MGDATGPPWLFLLEVFVGLPAALWAYKCLMLVLFQRRIIYLPSVPPGTRDESLDDSERTSTRDASLAGLDWRQVRIRSATPTRWFRRPVVLQGLELSWRDSASRQQLVEPQQRRATVVIVYLQGNAGTPLLRVPLFRSLLREPREPRQRVSASTAPLSVPPKTTILAVAPRTFWRSTRSTPTEQSVLADYRAALAHAYARHGHSAYYVLYGHSLGGAAAVLLTAPSAERQTSAIAECPADIESGPQPPIAGLILENPLPSIPWMVRALYPQRWLPYHYLGPLAYDKWDALGRLEQSSLSPCVTKGRMPRSLWIRSGSDEIIPGGPNDGVRRMYAAWLRTLAPAQSQSRAYEVDASPSGGDGRRDRWLDITGALHDTAYLDKRWQNGIRSFLADVASSGEGLK